VEPKAEQDGCIALHLDSSASMHEMAPATLRDCPRPVKRGGYHRAAAAPRD